MVKHTLKILQICWKTFNVCLTLLCTRGVLGLKRLSLANNFMINKYKNILGKENKLLVLRILYFFVIYSKMTLLLHLFIIKILVQMNISQDTARKHGQLVLATVRSLEQFKCEWFEISKDIIFIKSDKNENLVCTSTRIKLAIKIQQQ